MLQKTNIEGLVKDTENGVILNNNMSEYQLYLQNKSKVKQSKSIQEDIDNLKKEFCEIKSMLQELINGKNNV
jgi:hypothetical protein